MTSKKTNFLIYAILFCIFAFCICSYVESDIPRMQVEKFVQESVVRSIAPYVD